MGEAQWTRLARSDLANADDYYSRLDPDYADRVGRMAVAAGHFLTEYPHAGPITEGGLRKWRVPSTDFVLLYRIVGDGVEIVRLRHGREDWRTMP